MTIHTQFANDNTSAAPAFVMQGQTLAKALTAIKCDMSKVIPILSCVRLTGDDTGLYLTTTTLDQVYVRHIALDGLPTFDICTPYKELVSLTKAKAKAAIVFDVSAGLSLDGMALTTRTADDFPVTPEPSELGRIRLNGAALKPLLNAMSQDDARWYLRGLYVHGVCNYETGQARAVFVATDGHRLSRLETDTTWPESLPLGGGADYGAILPAAFVQFIAKQGDGELILSKDRATFITDETVASSQLVEGSYPDYQRVIPTRNSVCAMVQKDLLVSGLKIMKALSAERTTAVRFTFSDQALTLTHNGQSHIIANAPHDEQWFDIGFNAAYVLDVCGDSQGETLTFEFSDASSPALIRNGARTFVLMPMRC